MVEIFKSVSCITEEDIQVGDFVKVDFCDSLYKVYEVEDDQVRTDAFDGSFWIDLAMIESVEKQAFNNIKKDDKKMTNINVTLNETQIEELIQNVEITDYIDFMTMDEWNDLMTGETAIEIIESIDMNNFDTGDEYAVLDGSGYWNSSDDLEEILEPYLDDMLQEYLDGKLR